jgi:HlyD family secretion protein
MIRRMLPLLLALAVVAGFGWTLYFLYEKSLEKPIVYETATPKTTDIVEKTVASGAIVPRREIAIKPRVSGVVEKLYVEPGHHVKQGDQIAKIKIIPNVVTLNSAEARLDSAKISLTSAEKEYQRIKKLLGLQLLSQSEFARAELEYNLAKQEVQAAGSNLQLVREGAARGSGKVSNVVTSTVEGMVIEVPVKEGTSVIETNNFNEGTTIASVADMTDMIFQGHVDESEVGKLKEGMPVSISVGALERTRFEGALEYISPKGVSNEGTIEFEVRAAVRLKEGTFVRANYSANADIILERRNDVLAVRESLVQFDKGKPYVEVETAPQVFARKDVKLGLSDGLNVQVLEGVSPGDRIKQNGVGPDGKNGASGHGK